MVQGQEEHTSAATIWSLFIWMSVLHDEQLASCWFFCIFALCISRDELCRFFSGQLNRFFIFFSHIEWICSSETHGMIRAYAIMKQRSSSIQKIAGVTYGDLTYILLMNCQRWNTKRQRVWDLPRYTQMELSWRVAGKASFHIVLDIRNSECISLYKTRTVFDKNSINLINFMNHIYLYLSQ